ncbi:MAG: hypothetical protein CMC16_01730 [Flavobacteriaceae bacterium]|nr:hypothetical protein [Flavobacteriaceae bacterium]
MIFILKYIINMELIDTPNPNAKKILIDQSLSNEDSKDGVLEKKLNSLEGISSVFFGPGFLTILKDEDIKWESIIEDITNIFDKL